MRTNPAKCSFSMQADMFLGFILAKRGIEANPNKCQATIDMRSPFNVKEVKQLTGHLFTISRFLSCVGDKGFHLFATLKKKEKFEQMSK